MKSKKIVAMFVALVTFMAVATSGLAATRTTTTYSLDKVTVVAEVDAEAGSEVTYLVTNSDGDIVYIDQQTATSGIAAFSYKIATNKIEKLRTNVQLGTNGNIDVDSDGNTGKILEFAGVEVTGNNIKSVEYFLDEACTSAAENMLGNNPEQSIFVKIIPFSGYNITNVTGGVDATFAATQAVVKCNMGATVNVATEKIVSMPSIETWSFDYDEAANGGKTAEEIGIPESEEETEVKDGVSYVAKTTFFKVSGETNEDFGVIYDGEKYSANPNGAGYYAVRIIVNGTEIDSNKFDVYGIIE